MLRRILCVLILPCILLASGDMREMEKKLETAPPTEKLDILLKLSFYYHDRTPHKTIEYATQALHLSRRLKDETSEGLALLHIGLGLDNSDQYKKSLDYYNRARRILERIGDRKQLADLWRHMGNLYWKTSEFEKALEYYDRCLEYLGDTIEKKEYAKILNNKSLVYYDWGKLDNAVSHLLEALKIIEMPGNEDKRLEGVFNANLGRAYFRVGDFENALRHLHRALDIVTERRAVQTISYVCIMIALIYKEQGNFDAAFDYCNRSMRVLDTGNEDYKSQNGETLLLLAELHIAQRKFQEAMDCLQRALENYREIDARSYIAISLQRMGFVRKEMGQFPEALKDLKQAAEIAIQINMPDILHYCYLYLAETYSALGDSEQSLQYYKMYNEVKEKVFNEVTAARIRNSQVKYETQKMQKKIEVVTSSKQRIFLVFTGIVLVLGLALALVLYNRRRIKTRAQILLEQKDREIEFHKKSTNSVKEQVREFLSQKSRKKYEASNLTPEQEEVYLSKLLRYMKEEKPHLNSELTVKRLAGGLSLSYRDISQVINERTGMHFHDFVNRYRVEEAKRLLRESIIRDELSILSIAYEVGFNSKSSFNTAFKKAAGITPSQYRKAYFRSLSRN